MKVYLAGFISGNKINECMSWRQKIIDHYNNWKGKEKYPIEWLNPLNGKNIATITEDGLKSNIPPKMILAGDIMSVKASDLVIANMNKFGETRDMTGTTCEIAIAGYLGKPVIIITTENNYKNHPFLNTFATVIIDSVDELLEKKYINYFFKRINDSVCEDENDL